MDSLFQCRDFKVRGQSISMLGGQLWSHPGREVTQGPIGYEYDGGNEQRAPMVPLMGGLWGDWKGSSAFVTMSIKSMKLQ